MMVLVTRQRRPPRKRLLAVSVRAFIGSLARVDAAMSRKGAAITERLDNTTSAQIFLAMRPPTNIPFHNAHTCEAFHQCVHAGAQ